MTDRVTDTIRDVKRRLKRLEVATLFVLLATFVLGALFTAVLLDALFILDRWARQAIFGVFAVVAAAGLAGAVWIAFKRISDLYAARAIERHHAPLREALVTWLDPTSALPPRARRDLAERIVRELPRVDFAQVVRSRVAQMALSAAVAVGTLFAASGLVAGRGFLACLARVAAPFVDTHPPTATVIAGIAPGSTAVRKGTPVALSARVEGRAPEAVTLYLTYDGAQWFHAPLERRDGVWTVTLTASESFDYFLTAGDTKSSTHRIEALGPPEVTDVAVTVVPPAYTGLAPAAARDGRIEALEGSRVLVRAKAGRDLAAAALVFDDGSRIRMERPEPRETARAFPAERSARFLVRVTDLHGFAGASAVWTLRVRPDRPPRVDIAAPPPEARARPGDAFALTVLAMDDIGLKTLALWTRGPGGERVKRPLAVAPGTKGGTFTYRFALGELGVGPGDALVYYVEAEDLPSSSRSRVHVLRIESQEEAEVRGAAEAIAKLVENADVLREMGIAEELGPEGQRGGGEEERRRKGEEGAREDGGDPAGPGEIGARAGGEEAAPAGGEERTEKQGDTGTERPGDAGREGQGDTGTRGRGDGEMGKPGGEAAVGRRERREPGDTTARVEPRDGGQADTGERNPDGREGAAGHEAEHGGEAAEGGG